MIRDQCVGCIQRHINIDTQVVNTYDELMTYYQVGNAQIGVRKLTEETLEINTGPFSG